MIADGGLCAVQLFRRSGEAHMAGSSLERAQKCQMGQMHHEGHHKSARRKRMGHLRPMTHLK